MQSMLLIQKWDSFEIDKLVVLSSRGEELKNLTVYDKLKKTEDYVCTKTKIDESFSK